MINNTRNRSNDTTESQKKSFNVNAGGKRNLILQCVASKINKMWFLKSVVMSKCESRTSLHAIQYK